MKHTKDVSNGSSHIRREEGQRADFTTSVIQHGSSVASFSHFTAPSLFSQWVLSSLSCCEVLIPEGLSLTTVFPLLVAVNTIHLHNSHLFILNVWQGSRKQIINTISGGFLHRLTLKLDSLSEIVTYKSDPIFTKHIFNAKHQSKHFIKRFHIIFTHRLH